MPHRRAGGDAVLWLQPRQYTQRCTAAARAAPSLMAVIFLAYSTYVHRKSCAMLDAVRCGATRRLVEGVQMTAGYTPQHGYIAGDTGIQGKITPLMPQGKSARAAAARSRPSSLPAAAVKRTGRTTSAPSLRTNPEFAWPGLSAKALPLPRSPRH
jgi:hypothetical protein